MVRRHTTALRATLMAADFGIALVLFVVASQLRYGGAWELTWHRIGLDPWLAALLYASGWTFIVLVEGLYRVRARYSLRGEAIALARGGVVLALATVTVLFVYKVSDASRLLLVSLIPATVLLAIVGRVALRGVLSSLRRDGRLTRFMLVAGSGPAAQEFADRVEHHADLGLRVIGHLRSDENFEPTRPVLGNLDDIEDVLHARVVDEVAICLPVASWDFVEPATQLCASEGKIVRIPADGGPPVHGGYSEVFDGSTLTSLVHGPDRALALALKRLIDVCLASLGLLMAAPVIAVIALYVARREGRPVIYRQRRVGLHGREFELLKFRTMVPDAEVQREQLAALNEIRGRAFKITDDPRLTPSGRWLRRTSFDELPQLWNVLRGEMSLVGPRPPLPEEVRGYDVWHRRRLSMKPGMTGLWQVSARHEADFDRWVEHDLEYIDRWSLWLDVKIMARTVPAIVTHSGR